MAIKKIKLPGMTQPVDIGTTWANISGKPDLMTSSEITSAINAAFATNDAMVFKGTIGAGGTVTQLPATHEAGWTYKVISNGSLAGQTCEIGDMIVCVKDGTVADASDWTVIQTNVDGAVTGPASSTAGHIATFTGTTGKVIQDSGFTIAKSVPANAVFTDTTYENKTAASGGTDVSLVTTGDKYNWNNIINRALNPTNIRTSYAGASSETPRYIPGKWYVNTGKDPQNGDIYIIQIPIASTAAGIYLSVNGTADTNYHPIILNTTTMMTTHFAEGTTLMLVYESDSIGSIYELEPTTNSKANVTGIFRVLNFYDTNSNTLLRTYASSSTNELPIPGMASSTSMGIPTHTSSYKDIYGGIPATTANRPVIKLSTGVLRSPAGIELGTSQSKLGNLVFHNTSNTNKTTIQSGTPSSAVTLTLPASTGTLALTSEIVKPTMKSIPFITTWAGSGPYTQTVTVSGYTITSSSKVDLQPDEATITQLIEDGVRTLYISNTNGILTAIAAGAAPTTAMTIQCTIVEVNV